MDALQRRRSIRHEGEGHCRGRRRRPRVAVGVVGIVDGHRRHRRGGRRRSSDVWCGGAWARPRQLLGRTRLLCRTPGRLLGTLLLRQPLLRANGAGCGRAGLSRCLQAKCRDNMWRVPAVPGKHVRLLQGSGRGGGGTARDYGSMVVGGASTRACVQLSGTTRRTCPTHIANWFARHTLRSSRTPQTARTQARRLLPVQDVG